MIRMELEVLDDVALDRIIAFLTDDDLRSFHQVCCAWKSALESRSEANQRRLHLVQQIRKNKENLNIKEDNTPATAAAVQNRRNNVVGLKPENIVLKECSNFMASIVSPTPQNDATGNITPISHFNFQIFDEAKKSLKKGQKLFQCSKCLTPVPSPIFAPDDSDGSTLSSVSKNKIEATKCRLISRMGATEERGEVRKKIKTPNNQPSSLAISPIIPTTQAFQSLTISSPKLQKSEATTPKTSLSSQGIDLDSSTTGGANSIDCSLLNFSNMSFGAHAFSPIESVSLLHRKIDSISVSSFNLSNSSIADCGVEQLFPNVILSPPTNSISKSTSTPQPVVLMEGNTLNNAFKEPESKSKDDQVLTPLHDKNDINFSTCKSHSMNDIKELSFEQREDCDIAKSMTLSDINGNIDPSLLCKSEISKASSGYFSESGRSMLRSGEGRTFFSELSSVMLDHTRDDCSNSKSRSLSLGNVLDSANDQERSLESCASCPNLGDSFVLECPNPNCSFRFCSSCSMMEHTGKPCQEISSESFEIYNEKKPEGKKKIKNKKCSNKTRKNFLRRLLL